MFDYLLSKPITLNTFNIIEHKLRQIYDYIINHAEDYEHGDVTDLFKRTSDKTIKYANSDKDPKEVDKLIRRYTPDDVKGLKERYQNGEFEIKEQMLEELKDILSTFWYAATTYIEDAMDSWYYYKKITQPILDDPDPTDEDWNNMFNARRRITDLAHILFGFDIREEDITGESSK